MPDRNQFPEVCGWFGVRRIVMRNTMEEVKRLESEGTPVTSKKFSEIIKGQWVDAKKGTGKNLFRILSFFLPGNPAGSGEIRRLKFFQVFIFWVIFQVFSREKTIRLIWLISP